MKTVCSTSCCAMPCALTLKFSMLDQWVVKQTFHSNTLWCTITTKLEANASLSQGSNSRKKSRKGYIILIIQIVLYVFIFILFLLFKIIILIYQTGCSDDTMKNTWNYLEIAVSFPLSKHKPFKHKPSKCLNIPLLQWKKFTGCLSHHPSWQTKHKRFKDGVRGACSSYSNPTKTKTNKNSTKAFVLLSFSLLFIKSVSVAAAFPLVSWAGYTMVSSWSVRPLAAIHSMPVYSHCPLKWL